ALSSQGIDTSFQILESLLHQITLYSTIPREVPPVLQWRPGATVPVPKGHPLTLWSGLPATLVMTVPATAIYFTAYDQPRLSYVVNP
ncbi:hypothetical protein HispidOSU_012622, partial [Sigmodon hispidus]